MCTVPYSGVDKVKVKVNVEVKVNIRRRLGEATPSASVAIRGVAKRKHRQDKTSPRAGVAKVECHKSKAITVLLPDTHG